METHRDQTMHWFVVRFSYIFHAICMARLVCGLDTTRKMYKTTTERFVCFMFESFLNARWVFVARLLKDSLKYVQNDDVYLWVKVRKNVSEIKKISRH